MPWRILGSAALAGQLLAGDIVILALYLNPQVTLRKDGLSLLVVLFLPYAVVTTLALWGLALVFALARGWPSALRSRIPGLPWLGTLVGTSLAAGVALFAFNLVHYRHSVPLEVLP